MGSAEDPDKRSARLKIRREAMAKFRRQRRDNILHLQVQEAILCDILKAMLRNLEGYNSAYKELVREQRNLLREKYRLEDTISQYEKLCAVIKSSSSTTVPPPETPINWINFKDDEPPFFYEPKDTTEVVIPDIIVSIYQTRCALDQCPENDCFGWKVRRSIEDRGDRPMLRFRYTKRIPSTGVCVQELQSSVWRMATETETHSVIVKPVEVVDSDTMVVFQNVPDAERLLNLRCFSVIKKMWSSNRDSSAAMVISRALDRPLPHSTNEVVRVKTVDTCMRFTTALGRPTIKIEYVGSIQCIGAAHASFMAVETCAALRRWEQMALPSKTIRAMDDQ